jgi:hypothetical protein
MAPEQATFRFHEAGVQIDSRASHALAGAEKSQSRALCGARMERSAVSPLRWQSTGGSFRRATALVGRGGQGGEDGSVGRNLQIPGRHSGKSVSQASVYAQDTGAQTF